MMLLYVIEVSSVRLQSTKGKLIMSERTVPLSASIPTENNILRNTNFVSLSISTISAFTLFGAQICHASTETVSIEPTVRDIQLVQMAFKDFDQKRLADANKEFSGAILKWKELNRPRDEIVSLYKARANVRLDDKNFVAALDDFNAALDLMRSDGEKEDGTGRYPEYPDTFVGRALAYEGLAKWSDALADYNYAIKLWGGGRGEGINPFVLTFRGNTLCTLGRYGEAIADYEAASDRFNAMRDIERYSDAKANLALALYEQGRVDEAVKVCFFLK